MKNLLLLIPIIFFSTTIFSQPIATNNVEFTVRLVEDGCFGSDCYQVFMRPTEDFDSPVLIGSNQLTLAFPTSVNSEEYTIISEVATWGVNGTIACSSTACFHAFGTTGVNYPNSIAAGEEVHLFSVIPDNGCINDVRLFINGTDPQDPDGAGGDFRNTFVINYDVDGDSDLEIAETYLGNYDNDPIDCSILPVQFLSFNVTKADNYDALIRWSTATETNNDYFLIEKSVDPGKSFYQIGKIKGAGSSKNVKKYSYKDKNPKSGVNYYRVKQVDIDGESMTTDIKSISFSSIKSEEFTFYPNPSTTEINISLPTDKVKPHSTLILYKLTGEKVFEQKVDESSSSVQINYTSASIDSGVYFLLLKNGNSVLEQGRVIVQ